MIERFLPSYRLRQISRVAVAADPARAWATVRSLDTFDVPLMRPLAALRTMPERLLAWLRRSSRRPTAHLRIEDITAPGSGFVLLGEQPGREVVVGAVGQFWRPAIRWRFVAPAELAAFAEPGWGKVVWNLRVDPREGGGSWVSIEVRVTTTDAASWRRFRRYWWLIGRFSEAIRAQALALLRRELGAPRHRRPLEGDEVLPGANFQRTHGRVIEAPPSKIWPGIVQIAAGRARTWFDVVRVEPDHAMVLASPSRRMSWAFVLDPIGDSACELVTRVRAEDEPHLGLSLRRVALELAHSIMDRRQLDTVARRVTA